MSSMRRRSGFRYLVRMRSVPPKASSRREVADEVEDGAVQHGAAGLDGLVADGLGEMGFPHAERADRHAFSMAPLRWRLVRANSPWRTRRPRMPRWSRTALAHWPACGPMSGEPALHGLDDNLAVGLAVALRPQLPAAAGLGCKRLRKRFVVLQLEVRECLLAVRRAVQVNI